MKRSPDIVLFGESLDAAMMERAFRSAVTADVLLIIGSGRTGEPAASLAGYAAENGGVVIEVDSVRSAVAALATYSLVGDIDKCLDALIEPPLGA